MAQKLPVKSLTTVVGAVAAAALYVMVPKHEGTKLKTYRDPVGILTYCTGATENAIWGKEYTREECLAQLDKDLVEHAEGVMRCIKAPMTTGQIIAYVDLAYNIGVAAFCGSTAAREANKGNLQASCDALMLWIKGKINGALVVLPGLVTRREEERKRCLGQL